MSKLALIDGVRVAMIQFQPKPGFPEHNARQLISLYEQAVADGADIAIAGEVCLTGYLLADVWYQRTFLKSVALANDRVIAATTGKSTTLIFGSVEVDWNKTGQDGQVRRYNAAIVAADGKRIPNLHGYGATPEKPRMKTLQPLYRYFFDPRYFFGAREYAESLVLKRPGVDLEELLCEIVAPFPVQTRKGIVLVGVGLCEDMWSDDYAPKPFEMMADYGADILVNLSASPNGWGKDDKRHRVIRKLQKEVKKPFFYVNWVGCNIQGKAIVGFDGGSCAYTSEGIICQAFEPWETGVKTFDFSDYLPEYEFKAYSDDQRLIDAVLKPMQMLLEPFKAIVFGNSGGVDSATTAGLLYAAGLADRVISVNMPYRNYNGEDTKNDARTLARNFGFRHLEIPIDDLVDANARDCGLVEGTLEHKNSMAIFRMSIIRSIAQKHGGIFLCNSNKVEAAFGYTTLYGDLAGAFAFLIDLLKGEVYQLADALNRLVFGKALIPQSIIDRPPMDELAKNRNADPFIYGTAIQKGYHDQIVRYWVEFKRDIEETMEQYLCGTLDTTLGLEPGTIAKHFPTPELWLADVIRCWNLFEDSVFKHNQAPYSLVFSRTSFADRMETPFRRERGTLFEALHGQILTLK